MGETSFNQKIYKLTSKIPIGKVATYGQIAALAGSPRASRIVGTAMARAPEDMRLPCHRVVYQDGSLCKGDAFGAAGWQKAILDEEGVIFLKDGRVDLSRSLWQYEGQLKE